MNLDVNTFLLQKNIKSQFASNPFIKTEERETTFDETKHFVRSVFNNEIIIEIDYSELTEENRKEAYRIQGLNYESLKREGFEVYFFNHEGKSPYLRLYNINFDKNKRISQFTWFVETYCLPLSTKLNYDKSFYGNFHWCPIEYQKHYKYDKIHSLINFSQGDNTKIIFKNDSKIIIGANKVSSTYWELLKKPNPNEQERVSCVMKIFNAKQFTTPEEIFNYIEHNNEWTNFDEKITRKKIDYIWNYTLKPNPNIPQIIDDIVTGVFNIQEYRSIFINTHKHLHSFELVDLELGLQGEEYYALKKAQTYFIESLRQPTIISNAGVYKGDNRFHFGAMIDAGFGKGQIKAIPKQHISCVEINGSRTHIEQLIGKMVKEGKKTEPKTIKGYFDKKCIIADECQTLVKEDEPHLASIMTEFRKAMDIYGRNKVEKKLVGDASSLSYCPETRVLMLMHKSLLPPLFFELGTSRRLFMFEVNLRKIRKDDVFRGFFLESKSKELEDYINFPSGTGISFIEYNEHSKILMIEWMSSWQRFILNHENPKIQTIGLLGLFSINYYFFKCVNILSVLKGQVNPTDEVINQACFDCVQFLLETFKCYTENSSVDLSRVVWRADDADDAWLLQWMFYNNAVSEDETPLSISAVQEKISNQRGINERMARRFYSQLKVSGLIQDSRGLHTSKCWTNVKPKTDSSVELNDFPPIDFKQFLLDKKKELGYEGDLNANVDD